MKGQEGAHGVRPFALALSWAVVCVLAMVDQERVMENRGKFRVCVNYAEAKANEPLVAAPAAGTRLYVTDVVFSAGVNAGEIRLLNGSNGSVIVGPVWLPANGALAHHFGVPARLDQATALHYTSQGVTTHSVTVHGYVQ